MTDLEALTLTIWGEARGEPIEGQIGVAMVMRNRLLEHYCGAQSYVEVCTAHDQFSAWAQEREQMQTASQALVWTASQVWQPALRLAHQIAQATLDGKLADNTGGANHYYASSIPAPQWALDQPVLAVLGAHRFYKVA